MDRLTRILSGGDLIARCPHPPPAFCLHGVIKSLSSACLSSFLAHSPKTSALVGFFFPVRNKQFMRIDSAPTFAHAHTHTHFVCSFLLAKTSFLPSLVLPERRLQLVNLRQASEAGMWWHMPGGPGIGLWTCGCAWLCMGERQWAPLTVVLRLLW